ncbi:hypothetical protein [Promicromonospora iranensis]|uniref:Diketogulonate reductase-like aldo/keto reductase n=1 Tax=Promicromonospora iranensis TaxID=1105144 RepID=A0ABU2CK95_9MICO|nr:hypothetical protein [Promicromonospora iranensis]MDR7381744.1 diketogulonate reductase-like aldo/keto reductase [Promicromonospora iranensis]
MISTITTARMSGVTLNDGRDIPRICFGAYLVPPTETERLVGAALGAGYRHIDTARYYRNDAKVPTRRVQYS